MPIVYGSSSNLLSIREKNTNLLPRKHCSYLHCSPALFCSQIREFFGTAEAFSLLCSLFFSPRSQIVAFKQWPFFRGGQLLILGWISLLIVLCFLPCCGRCHRSRRGDHPVLITQPSTKPGCAWVDACTHGHSQTAGSLSYLHIAKTPSVAHNSHRL